MHVSHLVGLRVRTLKLTVQPGSKLTPPDKKVGGSKLTVLQSQMQRVKRDVLPDVIEDNSKGRSAIAELKKLADYNWTKAGSPGDERVATCEDVRELRKARTKKD